jgi:D-glycero-D-manno-heptose 1,7-bisphosphate phosphatase
MRRAVFLDLNGTLVLPVLIGRLSELRPIPASARAVARLSAAGFVCPVVTIQSRIAKGYFSTSEFGAWFATLADDFAAEGAVLSGPYFCPHRFAHPCVC